MPHIEIYRAKIDPANVERLLEIRANQVAWYFNYVNRVADGLGVELEPDWPEEVRRSRRYGLGRT